MFSNIISAIKTSRVTKFCQRFFMIQTHLDPWFVGKSFLCNGSKVLQAKIQRPQWQKFKLSIERSPRIRGAILKNILACQPGSLFCKKKLSDSEKSDKKSKLKWSKKGIFNFLNYLMKVLQLLPNMSIRPASLSLSHSLTLSFFLFRNRIGNWVWPM